MDIGSVGLSQAVDNSLENDLSRELRVERFALIYTGRTDVVTCRRDPAKGR